MIRAATLILLLFFSPSAISSAGDDQNIPVRDTTKQPEATSTPNNANSAASTEPLNPFWTIPLAPLSLLVPGSAHYIRGEKPIARRIFRSGIGSILVALAAGTALAATGAADDVILPSVPLVFVGLTSWFSLSFADLVGSTLKKSKPYQYEDRWNSTWSAYYRYRRINDYFFDTSYYQLIGGEMWFDNKFVLLGIEKNPSGDISHYDAGFGMQVIPYNNFTAREGLYGQVNISHEDNLSGFYRQDTVSWMIKSIVNFAAIGPHLNRLVATHSVGIQQHYITYKSPNFSDTESSTGLTGGFDLSWVVSENLKPALGYIHERDTTISNITTGFTGVYYMELETSWWKNYFVAFRGFLGNAAVYEMTLEMRM